MLKDYCPGFFDPTPGGVGMPSNLIVILLTLGLVAAGESYEVTNTREVQEEMGIGGVPMEHLFTFYYEDGR
jgi:8-oxo-dGTP pyrophosphatase MutT (NUDIX family)